MVSNAENLLLLLSGFVDESVHYLDSFLEQIDICGFGFFHESADVSMLFLSESKDFKLIVQVSVKHIQSSELLLRRIGHFVRDYGVQLF